MLEIVLYKTNSWICCFMPILLHSTHMVAYMQVSDTAGNPSYFPPVVPVLPPRIPIRLQHLHSKRKHVPNKLQQEGEDIRQPQELGMSLLAREGSFHLPAIPPPTAVLHPFTNNEVKDTPQLIPLV